MTENEAIEVLSNELIVIANMIGYCKDFEKESDLALAYRVKRKEAHIIAISALKEIQLYKDNKLCLVPEDVYSRQCSKLDAYKEIGTVEECREAVEKQKGMQVSGMRDDLISRKALLKQFIVSDSGRRIPEYDIDNFPITLSVKDVKDIIRKAPTAFYKDR